MRTVEIDTLRDHLIALTDRDDRSEEEYEALRDALSELAVHRDAAEAAEGRSLGVVCKCGHVRGDHLLGRGSCNVESADEDACDCGVFRGAGAEEGNVEYSVTLESPDGLVTVRVRAVAGADPRYRHAAECIAADAAHFFRAAANKHERADEVAGFLLTGQTFVSVNGERMLIARRRVSYEEVVEFAGVRGNPSVTWKQESRGQRGILVPGVEIAIEDGIEFRVVHTGGG